MSVLSQTKRLTTRDIGAMKRRGEHIAMLTAYDHVTAGLLDQSGIDILLVGDSLGNVVLGYETTVPVALDDMIRHASAVQRGSKHALVVCDLPFGTAIDPDTALRNAIKVLQAVHQLGGYYRHGKTEAEAATLLADALALQAAGAFAIVLEVVVPEVAKHITEQLDIPTIGIGSGDDCAGQVLVINDLIGLGVNPPPSFAKPKADVAAIVREAAAAYIFDVKTRS